jgi:hypothetical protein
MGSPQSLERSVIACDERLLLLRAPPFQLPLPVDGFCLGVEGFGIREAYWSPSGCVPRRFTAIVSPFARGEIVCVTDVQRVVRAAQDVDEWHVTAQLVPLDSLRSLGTPLDSALGWPATSEARRAESSGAEGGIRTPTGLLQLAPEASASAVPPLPQVDFSEV